MIGYRVHRPDHEGQLVPDAAAYEATADGSLRLLADDTEVRLFAPGEWVSVEPFGRRLGEGWPPAGVGRLAAELHSHFCARYGMCGHDVQESALASQLMNDEDVFIDAIFEAAGGPVDEPARRREAARLIRKWLAEQETSTESEASEGRPNGR